jgi:hypothetical protein
MRISLIGSAVASLTGLILFFSPGAFTWFTFKIAKQQINCLMPVYTQIDPYAQNNINNITANYIDCNQNIQLNKSNIAFVAKDLFK